MAEAPATPAGQDSVTKLRAIAAVALLRLGEPAPVWPLLRQSANNTLRTQLIHDVARGGVDAALIIRRLEAERDVSVRRALILTLGHYSESQVDPSDRRRLLKKLLAWYRDDPDPGLHGAIDWLLRHDRRGDRPRVMNWGQGDALHSIDRELAGAPSGRRKWFVTREGHTMAIVRGPVQFRMGSPDDEVGRMPASDSPDEPLHEVRIPRSFAVSTKEVTVAQFRRFLEANPDVRARHGYPNDSTRLPHVIATFSPEDEGPQIAVTWYEAAMYCNWLSKREGIPEAEWVYPANLLNIKNGMKLPENYLTRQGYRLPTETEWEYAARAGSSTARFFGDSEAHLKEYAWYAANPPTAKGQPVDPADPQRTWPVGQLEPNDLGLFDVYGNVWEWTQNRMDLSWSAGVREDREDVLRVVTDTTARPRRGGAFPYEAAAARSASRGTVGSHPTTRRDNVGFRIARTVRP